MHSDVRHTLSCDTTRTVSQRKTGGPKARLVDEDDMAILPVRFFNRHPPEGGIDVGFEK